MHHETHQSSHAKVMIGLIPFLDVLLCLLPPLLIAVGVAHTGASSNVERVGMRLLHTAPADSHAPDVDADRDLERAIILLVEDGRLSIDGQPIAAETDPVETVRRLLAEGNPGASEPATIPMVVVAVGANTPASMLFPILKGLDRANIKHIVAEKNAPATQATLPAAVLPNTQAP